MITYNVRSEVLRCSTYSE